MSPLPDTGTPEPSAEEDHARVLEMMGSPQMQRRLEEARAQREKVLAEKAATRGPEPQDPRVRLAWDRELGSAGDAGTVPLRAGEVALALPWLVGPPEPAPALPASTAPAIPRRWPRSRASGMALGLIAGLVLGTGLMRLAGPAPPASSTPPQAASGLPPALTDPSPEADVQFAAADLPGLVHPGPLPALPMPPSSDAPPLSQDLPPGPGGFVDLDWQVILHLPPHTTSDALQEARSALRAVGVGLIVGTGASRFGVARSEVRFFHKGDAPDAARIAAAMGARPRDFSAYRPTPPPGSFEVWLVRDEPASPSPD